MKVKSSFSARLPARWLSRLKMPWLYGEIADLRDKLAQEKLYLEDEIRGEMDFEGIVGQSSGLRQVLQSGGHGSSQRFDRPAVWRNRDGQGTDRARDS